jgi:arginine/ornithine N-succinyltransferase beta subunit
MPTRELFLKPDMREEENKKPLSAYRLLLTAEKAKSLYISGIVDIEMQIKE